MKNIIVTTYLIYLPVIILLTFYVAHSLFRNSLVYMKDIFNGRNEIAVATNTLFKIGFYLLNLGFGLYMLEISRHLNTPQEAIEVLSVKVGGFSIYLGCMLLLNMYVFFRGKKIAHQKRVHAQPHTQNAPK